MRLQKPIKHYIMMFVSINDSPGRIALGAGLGVFLGIIPGTGPLVALGLSVILPVNRLACLVGCLLTNTWLSVATFLLSIKTGAFIMKTDWRQVIDNLAVLSKAFHLTDLFRTAFLEVILPLAVGYFVLGVLAGILAYLVTLAGLLFFRRRKLTSKTRR